MSGHAIRGILRYILLTALRDRLFHSLGIMLLLILSAALLFGSTLLVEERLSAAVLFGGGMRLCLAVGTITFACFHLRRCLEQHEAAFMLATPLTRSHFICAYWLGLTAAISLLTITVGMLLFMLVPDMSIHVWLVWMLSQLLELGIVIAFAVASSLVLGSVMSAVMATLAFYLLSRIMVLFVQTVTSAFIMADTLWEALAFHTINFISLLLPRLDMLAPTQWLAYGVSLSDLSMLAIAQAALYIPLLLSVGVLDMRRKAL